MLYGHTAFVMYVVVVSCLMSPSTYEHNEKSMLSRHTACVMYVCRCIMSWCILRECMLFDTGSRVPREDALVLVSDRLARRDNAQESPCAAINYNEKDQGGRLSLVDI